MTYRDQHELSENVHLKNRIAQAVAGEAMSPDPDSWAHNFRRFWAAAPGWAAAWASYKVSSPGADPGLSDSVITDGMILAQVQSMAPPV